MKNERLPGRAYAKRQHVWLTGANEKDSQIFSRAILAKSAQIQTVVCIPLLDGVVEVGTTERVEEDVGFIQHISNFFILNHHEESQFMHPLTKPALSEHSTSNPPGYNTTSPPSYITINPQLTEEDKEEEEEAACSDSDTVLDAVSSDHVMMIHNLNSSIPQSQTQSSSDLMQLDISSEDIRSPDDGSNNMDSDYQHILPTPTSLQIGRNQDTNEFEELGRCQYGDHHQDPQLHIFHAPLSPSGRVSSFNELPMQEDTHYSQTVAAILQLQLSNRWCSDISISSATTYKIHHPSHSAFFKWSYSGGCSASNYLASSSQKKLKYFLFTLPFLYNSKDLTTTTTFTPTSREELTGANHVLAERRRREKLNERFIILRSLVPFVTKMDKASILGDTIEYVKQLRNKIQELEEAQENVVIEVYKEPKGCGEINIEKKMMRRERGKLKAGSSHKPVDQSVHVEVSIIEKDALVEMQCPHREGLLLDVMQMLRQLRLEITAVQSSLSNGLFVADLRAKVKENVKGKKATIMEVKKALHQTVSLPKQ